MIVIIIYRVYNNLVGPLTTERYISLIIMVIIIHRVYNNLVGPLTTERYISLIIIILIMVIIIGIQRK